MFTNQHCETWKYMPLYEKISLYFQQIQINENMQPYFDKLYSKEMVKGVCEMPKIRKIFDTPTELLEEELSQYRAPTFGQNIIVKCTHGSGTNIVVKNETTLSSIQTELLIWKQKFPQSRFFIEESIDDFYQTAQGYATSFYIRCLHGKAFAIDIKQDGNFKSYDTEWNEIPLFIKNRIKSNFEKPSVLKNMIETAELLSKNFEFMRVDFYINKKNKIIFSEFDFSPNGGFLFYQMKYEHLFGKLWK
jgi:hypothetical protein